MVKVKKTSAIKRNKSIKSKTKIKKYVKPGARSDKMKSKKVIRVDSEHSDSEELSDNDFLESNTDLMENEDVAEEPTSDEETENGDDLEVKHKKDLDRLKQTDPEFYNFLRENDKKLLNFNLSDEENESEEEEIDESKKIHTPAENLEVASDESDFEDEDRPKDDKLITLKTIKKWQTDIQHDKTNKTIGEVIHAFHAALKRVASAEEQQDEPQYYKVEGASVFNAVIQLCVLELGPAIRRFLGIQNKSKQPPHKFKKFVKVKRILKSYFTDLLKLLLGVTSANIQTVLLKHLHYMSNMLTSFPNISKSIVKKLISLWGTAEDSVRVVAFFCILRITNNNQVGMLETVLKTMYVTYVKNSKFVSLNSLASINFMRRSLVEMFTLDTNVSYSHVFLYVRQLAIHLRNAITTNKKENVQTVYNWQFVNSLRLWGSLLAVTHNKEQMGQLLYPFVQICLGTIKLVPTAQYYALRFHIVQILMDLSKDAGIFIPILPFLLEVLTSYDINKKHQKVSMKPLHFTCLLRLSKSQMQENGFKDSIIDNSYQLLLEYLTVQSNSIAFPDLSVLCVIQIKQFLKKCKNANYNKKIKQLLEKIEQNCRFIENERSKTSFSLTDTKLIAGWEAQIKNKGTPLSTYYESWSKLGKVKRNKQLTNNDELGDYNLPTLKKRKKGEVRKAAEGPVELFPSDSESDAEDDGAVKRKRGKRGGKHVNHRRLPDASGPVADAGEKDLLEDFNVDDW